MQIVAEAVTEVGDPKEAICEAVEKHNIKLLVLGSHGRGAVKRYALLFHLHLPLISCWWWSNNLQLRYNTFSMVFFAVVIQFWVPQLSEIRVIVVAFGNSSNSYMLGLGTWDRALLGSVSNYCVHNAKCPVLVVRKQEWKLFCYPGPANVYLYKWFLLNQL